MFLKTAAALLALSFLISADLTASAQSAGAPRVKRRTGDPGEFYRAPSTQHGKTVLIPAGTTWEGRIDTTISSMKSHPGEAFNIVMSSPVIINGTDVIVPAGSRIQGEVVEAVPADKVPRQKWEKKITMRGKLRVQVNALRTPDGMTYPMVANLYGEDSDKHKMREKPLGTGVAYIGSATSFEAVNPSMANRNRRSVRAGQAPRAVEKKDLLKDELHGLGHERWSEDQERTVRSLVLKKRDYYIYAGSPMTIKLVAPFRIGLSAPGMGIPITPVEQSSVEEELPPPSAREQDLAPPVETGFDGPGVSTPQASASPAFQPQSQPQPQQQANPNAAPSADSF